MNKSGRESTVRRVRGTVRVATAIVTAALAGAPVLPALGTSVGLSSVRSQRLPNQTVNGFPAQQNDRFAWALVAGDFDGDGRDELASGIPYDDWIAGLERPDAGGVVVSQYFPSTGLAPLKFLVQTPGLDPAEAGDEYGSALAVCDFNADGFDDLAVGIRYESLGSIEQAGAVQVHYGSASGVPSAGNDFISQNTGGVPGDAEDFDSFGDSLSCGDFDGDGFDDLVVGTSWEDLGFAQAAGMIVILPGGAFGLAVGNSYAIDQNTAGIDGSSEDTDRFGHQLAAGNFDGDAYVDLAIGVPGEDDVGAVQILFGSSSGLNGARDLFWYDEDLGGSRELDDSFGWTLATGDFDGDGFDDLAIGVPWEDAAAVNSGEVSIAFGDPAGFDLSRSQRFTQDTLYGAGATQAQDRFGTSLAAGDFDADGYDDLAVGTPNEFWTGPFDGLLSVLTGGPNGFSASRFRGIVAGLEGIPGNSGEHNKNFSYSLAAGDFDGDGHDDLAIGSPFENAGGIGDSGSQTVLYGVLFADGFEGPGAGYWSGSAP